MVAVTDVAKEELRRILTSRSLDSDKYLRLAIPPIWDGPGDFGIVIDAEVDGDHSVESEGLKLLLVDLSLADRLSDSVLDFKDSLDGPRFTLDVF